MLFVVLGVCSLLLGFSGNRRLHDVRSSQTLKLGLRTLDLDILSQLLVTSFSSTCGFYLCNVDVSVEHSLTSSEGSLGLGLLTVSLGLLDCCLGVDLGDFTVLLTLASGFTDVTQSLSFSHIDTSLIDGAFMSLSGEGFEVA